MHGPWRLPEQNRHIHAGVPIGPVFFFLALTRRMTTVHAPRRGIVSAGTIMLKRNIFKIILAAWAVALSLVALPSAAQKVPVTERFLSNGLKVLLVERDDEPTVSGGWVARVGSSNERPGMTGIAHLFEHMMFQGSENLGKMEFVKLVQ